MKMNLPQYVLTVINLLEYKTNIVAKEFDILCFTSILCIFFSCRCPTSKGHFFLKQINSESLFCLVPILGYIIHFGAQPPHCDMS